MMELLTRWASRVLAFLTGLAALLTAEHSPLHMNVDLEAWVTLILAVLTLVAVVFLGEPASEAERARRVRSMPPFEPQQRPAEPPSSGGPGQGKR
jgi:cytochrome c oxidase assembly factor CtaG